MSPSSGLKNNEDGMLLEAATNVNKPTFIYAKFIYANPAERQYTKAGLGILNPTPYKRLLRSPVSRPVSLPTGEGLVMRRLLSFHLIRCTFSPDPSLDSSLNHELFPGRSSLNLRLLFSFSLGL